MRVLLIILGCLCGLDRNYKYNEKKKIYKIFQCSTILICIQNKSENLKFSKGKHFLSDFWIYPLHRSINNCISLKYFNFSVYLQFETIIKIDTSNFPLEVGPPRGGWRPQSSISDQDLLVRDEAVSPLIS